jgi:CelD/BcsL family acetyltransferase involved in cellulose biosynthesis
VPVHPAVTVERVPPEAWERIGDWDEAAAEAASPSIFLTRDWVTAWLASFGAGRDPCLLRVASQDGRTLGIAPFYRQRLPGTPMQRLGLLGDRVVGSEYLGLVARRGTEAQVAQAVVAWLSAGRRTWALADLSGIREADLASERLVGALGSGAARTRAEEHPCAAIALPGDFEEYLAGLNSKFRQRYRQRRNKLLRECEVRFFRTESEAQLPAHLQKLFALHQSRWTEAGRPGAFADRQMRTFYLDVARRLLRSGRLHFWHLEVEGEIRATQFAFAYRGVLHSLQEGYDSSFATRGIGGLGVVLRGHVLQAAIEEGFHTYDFLGGVEDHKLRWGASVHAVRRVWIGRPGVAGRVGWLASVGVGSVRESAQGALPEAVLDMLRGARASYYRRRLATTWR